MPDLFETVVLQKDGYESLPKPEAPYYFIAREGNYLYKHTQIGDAILRENALPKTVGKLGFAGGVFIWQGDQVPGAIISQAHDFFRRIFRKHGTEAEVLITKHNETNEYRLFVPYQRANGAGVKSIYEPTHVSRDQTVVGTLHSHCEMGAFHSGTDSGDASDMDGVHFTIGHVVSKPEIVAMVAMNGKEFHYKQPEDIAVVEYDTATAPEWWDQFVFTHQHPAPEQKPRGLTSLTQEHWNEFLGRALVTPKVQKVWQKPTTWSPTTTPYTFGKPVQGHPERYRQYGLDDWDWRKNVYGGYKAPTDKRMDIAGEINDALDLLTEAGAFTDFDWDEAVYAEAIDPDYWIELFENRRKAINEAIRILKRADKIKKVPTR